MIITILRSGTNETLKLNSHVISMLLCVPVNNTFQRHILIVLKHLKVSSLQDRFRASLSPSERRGYVSKETVVLRRWEY